MAPGQGKKCTCTCTCRHCAAPENGEDVCWTTEKTRLDFVQGQILYIPLHVSNMNRGLRWGNPDLKLSSAGPVFSKYRSVVVFRKFHHQMECLPIYTNSGRGIKHKSKAEKIEWVSVKDVAEKKSPSKGASQPLFVSLDGKDVAPNSYIHITESVMVDCADDFWDEGRMERSSFKRLHEMRATLNEKVQQEAWVARRPGKSS